MFVCIQRQAGVSGGLVGLISRVYVYTACSMMRRRIESVKDKSCVKCGALMAVYWFLYMYVPSKSPSFSIPIWTPCYASLTCPSFMTTTYFQSFRHFPIKILLVIFQHTPSHLIIRQTSTTRAARNVPLKKFSLVLKRQALFCQFFSLLL